MIISDNLLFHEAQLSDVLRAQLATVTKEVDKLSEDQFLANSDDQIIEYVFSEMAIDPLVIYRDQMSLAKPQEDRKVQVDSFTGQEYEVPVIRMLLSIPYTGESDLWKMEPSTFKFNPPRGDYSPQQGNEKAGILRFEIEFTQGGYTNEAIKNDVEQNLKSIDDYLGWIKHDIESHNPQLKNEIIRQVVQRRERLGKIQSVTKTLNIPIYPREGAPSLTPVPLQKKNNPTIIYPNYSYTGIYNSRCRVREYY